ncbi:Matrix metalloproteinase-14 [Trachymyrmex zeteki]|uniref:Matrix metalloproteinase-14 n=1 Tax=Mycetomoellerius zeteki TaxID=64791 RepID=A0A151WHC1_9HYME|nr:Matrix metalloproteinase-14 [Trachymyrmex zeteki]
MFAFVSTNNTLVKLNIEDILAIQQLYGSKNIRPITTITKPPTKSTTTTTTTTTNKPDYVDLCNLQYVDTVLVLHHQIFITYQCYVWSININNKKYDGPFVLNSYMNSLPKNFTLSAAYQRSSGEIVLFVNNMVYMVDYTSFKLKDDWPKHLSSLAFPTNALINIVINTNRGQTYAIFDDHDVAQVDECSMSIRACHTLQLVFPGIPPALTLAFRHIDGNIYFANKQQFYKFNEFTKTVTEAGQFNINILNVKCSRDGLLQQLQDILNRLIRSKY